MINLRHLRAFVAVAEHLHFTKAAEAVYLTQPALSTLIRQLESDLGVRLVNRNTRVAELTPAGRDFYETARRVLAELDGAIAGLKPGKLETRGRVALAALPSISTYVLPGVLKQFMAAHPDTDLELHDLPGEEVLTALRSRAVDLGVGYAQTLDDIAARPLFRDKLVLFCAADSRLAARRKVRWRDLVGEPIIALAKGTTARMLVEATMIKKGIKLDIVMEPRLYTVALALANAGLGAAIVPSVGLPSALPSSLAYRELTDPVVRRDISLLTLKQYRLSPAAKALYEALCAARFEGYE